MNLIADDATCTWSGFLQPRIHKVVNYSPKVFLGGIPWDISEQSLIQIFKQFGPIKWDIYSANRFSIMQFHINVFLLLSFRQSWMAWQRKSSCPAKRLCLHNLWIGKTGSRIVKRLHYPRWKRCQLRQLLLQNLLETDQGKRSKNYNIKWKKKNNNNSAMIFHLIAICPWYILIWCNLPYILRWRWFHG